MNATPFSDAMPISTIVVNYNAGRFLFDCIASVLESSDEVIVVDNASTDGSLEKLADHYSNESRLRIVRNERNLGFASACNIGTTLANYSQLLYLNPDCVLESESVHRMVRALVSRSDVAMVGGLLVNPDGSEQKGGRRVIPTPWRSFVRGFGMNAFSKRWPNLFPSVDLHNQPLPLFPAEVEAISGACMLVKREAIEDVGLWDEGYFLHCEDLDWCMRFHLKAWKILFVPDAKVIHQKGVCSRSRPIFVEWHKHKGMMRFYRKFFKGEYPGALMWLVAVGVWMRFSLVASYYIAKHTFNVLGNRRA